MKNRQNEISSLCKDLLNWIKKNKNALLLLNSKCSQDTEFSMSNDFDFVCSVLESFYKNNLHLFNQRLKPKGKVIIILSYNEPMTMSIIPVLNALVAGNKLTVRPSSRGRDIFNYIWRESGIIDKYKLDLKIREQDSLSDAELKNTQALYFFGGYKNAKKMSILCSKYFIEFYPQIEAADFKIIKYDHSENFDIKQDVETTLNEAFSHNGQSCQRVQGVFVAERDYKKYSDNMLTSFNKFCHSSEIKNYISENLDVDKKIIKSTILEISKSKPMKIIKAPTKLGLPILVLDPNPASIFVQSAYFLPVIWIAKYSSEKELLEYIGLRQFHLGINIQSDNEDFISRIISNTNYTRYTVNTDHSRVRPEEGWGGTWPSGYTGYRSWIELFSYPYEIIRK
ncbi:MAG: aldehyde dehydrogenase family protein [Candidatus Woesebacteria bacterium]|nr:aldehyde dehydrogenase family protein [Candidatus Woesebacteria bacterium]